MPNYRSISRVDSFHLAQTKTKKRVTIQSKPWTSMDYISFPVRKVTLLGVIPINILSIYSDIRSFILSDICSAFSNKTSILYILQCTGRSWVQNPRKLLSSDYGKKHLALQHTSKREKCIGENMENIWKHVNRSLPGIYFNILSGI